MIQISVQLPGQWTCYVLERHIVCLKEKEYMYRSAMKINTLKSFVGLMGNQCPLNKKVWGWLVICSDHNEEIHHNPQRSEQQQKSGHPKECNANVLCTLFLIELAQQLWCLKHRYWLQNLETSTMYRIHLPQTMDFIGNNFVWSK